MPRNLSFAITTQQMIDQTKTVTRRTGWSNLRPGEIICAVEKGMGLKKGERIKRIGLIEIINVTQTPLSAIIQEDVIREGFPEMSPAEFVAMFCLTHKCPAHQKVTRIEFKHITQKG